MRRSPQTQCHRLRRLESRPEPSRKTPLGHGEFAEGVLESLDAREQSRPWLDPKRPVTLDDFQDAVVGRVKELTSRRTIRDVLHPRDHFVPGSDSRTEQARTIGPGKVTDTAVPLGEHIRENRARDCTD